MRVRSSASHVSMRSSQERGSVVGPTACSAPRCMRKLVMRRDGVIKNRQPFAPNWSSNRVLTTRSLVRPVPRVRRTPLPEIQGEASGDPAFPFIGQTQVEFARNAAILLLPDLQSHCVARRIRLDSKWLCRVDMNVDAWPALPLRIVRVPFKGLALDPLARLEVQEHMDHVFATS